jgi:sigma-B regulation protein RsbU (phosphoserine phosphatase)
MHYHIEQRSVEWLEASAPPMGLLAQESLITPSPIEMRPGDIFALISDGFFEYSDQSGEQFGMERIEDFIRSHNHKPLEDLRQDLCEAVRVFAGGVPQEDDMTIVLVRRNVT